MLNRGLLTEFMKAEELKQDRGTTMIPSFWGHKIVTIWGNPNIRTTSRQL